jgi:hypothetical protein
MNCSVSDRTLGNAEKRMQVLKEKGVPDSSLSSAMVQLYEARERKKRGEHSESRKAAGSMLTLVAKAEDRYEEDMKRLKPTLEEMKNKFAQARGALTGLPARRVDSMVAIIDSFININWLLEAEAEAVHLDTVLPRIKFDMERGNEVRDRIIGRWVCSTPIKHSADKTVNAKEEKVFTFGSDGKAQLVESKKGKSTPLLKEDWEFVSLGNYDLMGDTVFLAVDRFKSVRQNFEEKHVKDNKEVWEKKTLPTYDSTITDGSQNRYITFEALQEDFSKN